MAHVARRLLAMPAGVGRSLTAAGICSATEDSHYDVVVVGGGMAGCAMACSLGCSPLLKSKSVLLIDSAPKPADRRRPSGGFSNRVCAISHRSTELFQTMGVWSDIKKQGAHPVMRMVVWEQCSNASITFQEPLELDGKRSPVAFIIENHVMVDSFQRRMRDLKNVSFRYGATVKSYKFPDRSEEPVSLLLDNGDTVHASVLIGADGFNSSTREAMGVHIVRFGYGQSSIVGNLKLRPQGKANNTAWQRFTLAGTLAILPLSDEMSSLSWALDDRVVKRMMELSDADMTDALNSALTEQHHQNAFANSALQFIGSFLPSKIQPANYEDQQPPTIVGIEKRMCVPLGFVHATHYYAGRAVLIGDAAHRIHPLAGQGVNLGFADVQALTEALEEDVASGDSIGSEAALKKFETIRQRHVVPVAVGCDVVCRLYSCGFLPAVLTRSICLNLFDSSPAAKKALLDLAARPPRGSHRPDALVVATK